MEPLLSSYTIRFDTDYKGRWKDSAIVKLKSYLFWFLLITFFFVLIACTVFTPKGRDLPTLVLYILTALFYLYPVIIIVLPFLFIFLGINRGFHKTLSLTFKKEEDGQYRISVRGIRKNKEYLKDDVIQIIDIKKPFFRITLTQDSSEIYVPYKAIQEKDMDYLNTIEKDIRQRRVEETKNRENKK